MESTSDESDDETSSSIDECFTLEFDKLSHLDLPPRSARLPVQVDRSWLAEMKVSFAKKLEETSKTEREAIIIEEKLPADLSNRYDETVQQNKMIIIEEDDISHVIRRQKDPAILLEKHKRHSLGIDETESRKELNKTLAETNRRIMDSRASWLLSPEAVPNYSSCHVQSEQGEKIEMESSRQTEESRDSCSEKDNLNLRSVSTDDETVTDDDFGEIHAGSLELGTEFLENETRSLCEERDGVRVDHGAATAGSCENMDSTIILDSLEENQTGQDDSLYDAKKDTQGENNDGPAMQKNQSLTLKEQITHNPAKLSDLCRTTLVSNDLVTTPAVECAPENSLKPASVTLVEPDMDFQSPDSDTNVNEKEITLVQDMACEMVQTRTTLENDPVIDTHSVNMDSAVNYPGTNLVLDADSECVNTAFEVNRDASMGTENSNSENYSKESQTSTQETSDSLESRTEAGISFPNDVSDDIQKNTIDNASSPDICTTNQSEIEGTTNSEKPEISSIKVQQDDEEEVETTCLHHQQTDTESCTSAGEHKAPNQSETSAPVHNEDVCKSPLNSTGVNEKFIVGGFAEENNDQNVSVQNRDANLLLGKHLSGIVDDLPENETLTCDKFENNSSKVTDNIVNETILSCEESSKCLPYDNNLDCNRNHPYNEIDKDTKQQIPVSAVTGPSDHLSQHSTSQEEQKCSVRQPQILNQFIETSDSHCKKDPSTELLEHIPFVDERGNDCTVCGNNEQSSLPAPTVTASSSRYSSNTLTETSRDQDDSQNKSIVSESTIL